MLLGEAARLRIGDSEASVLPLVERYGGFKWAPETRADVGPLDRWTSKWAYEHKLRTLSDYAYDIKVGPWGYPTTATIREGRWRWWDRALLSAVNAMPVRVRSLLGLREWLTSVGVQIRGGHVSEVGAGSLVEGRSGGWILHEWGLAEELPDEDMPSRAFEIDRPILSGFEGYSEAIERHLTPKASEEEFRAAQTLNGDCLTSVRGCRGSCDLSGLTVRYLNEHPEVGPHAIPLKCE